MKAIRWVLGKLILFLDRIFAPTPMQRSAQRQQLIDGQTTSLKLYQFRACPFCVRVRRVIRRLNLTIETNDILQDPQSREEMLAGGKQYQAPCLRITQEDGNQQWLYESSAIMAYLENRFRDN